MMALREQGNGIFYRIATWDKTAFFSYGYAMLPSARPAYKTSIAPM